MKEIALYRKYRPGKFKEILGQDHIVKTLENSIKENNFSHAYLFSGSRGTGKTSIARILAQEIGCSLNDIHEIDAASNRKIDDVREIREAVHSLPFDSSYKTYIIDEVHMLTKEAFNALLKTLEEPPAHVVFVLATTEFEKLPDTISSRCQNFLFKKPTQEILKKTIIEIAKKEGGEIGNESADLIALLGDGSFRDAIVLLQKVLSSSKDKKMNHSDVALVLGAPKEDSINSIIEAIENSNLGKAIMTLDTVLGEGSDVDLILKLMLRKIRAIILLKYAPDMKEILKEDFSEKDFSFIEKLSKKEKSKINSILLKKLIEVEISISKSNIPRLPLEIALVEILSE